MASSRAPRRSAEAIERRPPSTLTPYARNARLHDDAQVDQLVSSFTEFGFVSPILVDEAGIIIAGHGRHAAALKLGLDEVPVIVARGWSEAKARRYRLLDNKIAENSSWDQDLLGLELGELRAEGEDVDGLGFSDAELGELLAERTDGETDADEVPEAPTVPVSVLGDVWVLGNHRIICGDSTDPAAVERVLAGSKPHLMVTDPPYGVKYDPAWRGKAKSSDGKRVSLGVHAKGQVLNDDRADWREAWDLFPGDVAYIWHAGLFSGVVADSLVGSKFALRSQIIWAKNNFAIGRGDYHWHHEPCWYAVREGAKGHWAGDRKQSTLWEIPKPQRSETGHGTQKPVECMKRPIENNSKPGDVIYEPFSGSGTTIVAGEMTGRHVRAIELNPAYVDVAATRWEQFAGKIAVLEETGETFADVKARRALEAAQAA